MPTTRDDIREWFEEAKRAGATHMIVASDTFSHEDYPVFVRPGENPREKAQEYIGRNMQILREVYAMHLDVESQLDERRSMHYEPPPRPKDHRRGTPPTASDGPFDFESDWALLRGK